MKTKLYCDNCQLEFTVNAKNSSKNVIFCPFCGATEDDIDDYNEDEDDDFVPEEDYDDE